MIFHQQPTIRILNKPENNYGQLGVLKHFHSVPV